MAQFSSTDWNRKSGDIFEAARRGPVTITHRKRPSFVVMSHEMYLRLSKAETRAHHTLDSLPDEIFAKAEAALEKLESEEG
jgi:prevent-host-death family protein